MTERRTLQEQVGVSLNATSLRIDASEPSAETSLVRVAALGAAVLHVRHGADRGGPSGAGAPIAEVLSNPGHQPKPIDVISGELAGALYHVRIGGQHELIGQAVSLFAAYAALRGRFGTNGLLVELGAEARAQLLRCFAERTLHEWLSDRCVACGGSGMLERTKSGSWVRPRGLMKRNASFRDCPLCHGSRRAIPSQTARRKALGISIAQYESQRWAQNFNAGLSWLRQSIQGRIKGPLTAQLERGTKRTQ